MIFTEIDLIKTWDRTKEQPHHPYGIRHWLTFNQIDSLTCTTDVLKT
jgi:hypothetical protein